MKILMFCSRSCFFDGAGMGHSADFESDFPVAGICRRTPACFVKLFDAGGGFRSLEEAY